MADSNLYMMLVGKFTYIKLGFSLPRIYIKDIITREIKCSSCDEFLLPRCLSLVTVVGKVYH